MPSLSGRRIASALRAGDSAPTAHARGKVLEDLMIYIMRRIPGVRFQEQAVLTASGSEELDLVFWNEKLANGLPFLPWILVIECKNWSNPVGSAEVSFFRVKAQERHLDAAILIAANGITGNVESRNAANSAIDSAFISSNGLKLIVITRAELEALSSTDQFVRMLQNKISKIVIRSRNIL